MGALHDGHMALVHRARQEDSTVCATIFVNPAQFGPREDFTWPTRATRRPILGSWSAPGSMSSSHPRWRRCTRTASTPTSTWAASPPGWRASIAPDTSAESQPSSAKLLAAVRPDHAYFGQKDAQQCVVVKRLNADLDLDAEIVVVPTVREPDGLALSSRNEYLSPPERRAAAVTLPRLGARPVNVRGSGANDAESIRREMRALIEAEPLARVDYVSIADPETLEELDAASPGALVSLAVYVGETRLIDNITL